MAYRVNVKGVFSRSHMTASVGGVLKKDGAWVRGVGGNIGLAVPQTAELWAIFYGLKMAWELEKTNVVVFSECREAIDAIKNPDPTHDMAMLVDLITNLLRENWEFVDVLPTYPDANIGAAAMANYYLTGSGGVDELVEPPAAIRSLV